jgi:protein ImuB
MPFACIFVPDFPAQAVVRLEPGLRGKPVAVFSGAPPLTRVCAANNEAKELGVKPGMTKIQAQAFTGIITWRWRSPSQEQTAHAALLDCAWTISPRVEDISKRTEQDLTGIVVLDISGCDKLFGPPEKMGRDLSRLASEVGFAANIAVAANRSAAICAAQGFPGITIISAGEESFWIGKLPLHAMGIPSESIETLDRWGIRTCAEFAALPQVAVVERLGQQGRHWQLLAQGLDPQPLIAEDFPDQFEECMELDSPVELLEPLLFVINRILVQLCVRLKMHILAIGEIKVSLSLQQGDSGKQQPAFHIRTIRLPVPAKESTFLLKLLRLDLEAHPPHCPVTAVRITVTPATVRSRQLGLFLPASPDPERLEITLARIQKAVGEGRIGSPMLLDSHRPNAFVQNRFVLAESSAVQRLSKPKAVAAMRIYRPAIPARLDFQEGKPVHLNCDGVRRQVLAFAGPWRTKGDWWSETTWARDEWDIEIRSLHPRYRADSSNSDEEDTALYRIYKDLRLKRWFVEGIYD